MKKQSPTHAEGLPARAVQTITSLARKVAAVPVKAAKVVIRVASVAIAKARRLVRWSLDKLVWYVAVFVLGLIVGGFVMLQLILFTALFQ